MTMPTRCRCRRRRARPRVLLVTPTPLLVLSICRAAHGASQNLKLPLHYAAAKGAPFEVIELLLNAHHEASTAADNARSRAQSNLTARTATRRVSHPCVCLRPLLPTEAASATVRCAG